MKISIKQIFTIRFILLLLTYKWDCRITDSNVSNIKLESDFTDKAKRNKIARLYKNFVQQEGIYMHI